MKTKIELSSSKDDRLRELHRKIAVPQERRKPHKLVNRALQARRTMRPNL